MEPRSPSPSPLFYSSRTQLTIQSSVSTPASRRLASIVTLALCFTSDEGNTSEKSLKADGPGACRETRGSHAQGANLASSFCCRDIGACGCCGCFALFGDTFLVVFFFFFFFFCCSFRSSSSSSSASSSSSSSLDDDEVYSSSTHPPGNLEWIQLTLKLIAASRLIVSLAE